LQLRRLLRLGKVIWIIHVVQSIVAVIDRRERSLIWGCKLVRYF
jgi:hypothetical protein